MQHVQISKGRGVFTEFPRIIIWYGDAEILEIPIACYMISHGW